jgi:uncharacterized protein (TIGR00269 family)
MVKCFYCNNLAAVYRRYSGEYLCKSCFIKSVEKKVKRTVNKYNLLEEDDKVALGISGGKDSLTMLEILEKIEKKFPRTELIAVTIDEGIKNYREEALKFAKATTKKFNLKHIIYSFKDIFGLTLDEMVKRSLEYGLEYTSPCSFCGVLRRVALNYAARDIKADKLATAHNLDDESQTSMMNFVRADFTRFFRTGPKLEFIHKKFITKIKPMTEIPEREILLYAYFTDIPLHSQNCPYAYTAMRNDIRTFLNNMEITRPEIKYNIFKISNRIRSLAYPSKNRADIEICSKCGEPTTQETCKTCQFLELIKGKALNS